MKKYIPILFILAIACAFSISAVVAADTQEYDFDGKFTMDLEKGLNLERTDKGSSVMFIDEDKGIGVMYMENSNFNPQHADTIASALESEGYNKVGTEGDNLIFEKDGFYMGCQIGDGIAILSISKDKSAALDAINSVKMK